MNKTKPMGISGRIAALFQSAPITPLLALMALLLGGFAVLVTPREEEPQIDVTMANVLVAFPGASVRDVEQMVATPGEQVLSKMAGVEHVMSVSRPGMAVLTVQFKVGVPNNEALVRLHDTLRSNSDWLPKGLGVMEPLIKPKGIDDVPIVTLTLHGSSPDTGAYELERVAHSIEADIKRVPGTRDVQTLGGPGRAVLVQIDPQRMTSSGVSVNDLRAALQSANLGLPVGELITANKSISIDAACAKESRFSSKIWPRFRTARRPLKATSGMAKAQPAAAVITRLSHWPSPKNPVRTLLTWPMPWSAG
jgi:multidrug efflux pump subunit AcrB